LLQPAPTEQFRNAVEDGLIEPQRAAEHLRHDFAGDVVTGRAKPPGDENDVAPGKCLFEDDADIIPVRNRRLPLDAETELEELLPEKGGMGY